MLLLLLVILLLIILIILCIKKATEPESWDRVMDQIIASKYYDLRDDEMLENTTFVIKTFERPNCIYRLLRLLIRRYPNAKIIAADDSAKPLFTHGGCANIRLYQLPFDVGVSAGRNFLVQQVSTPYFVLLDDDFVLTPDTEFREMYKLLKNDSSIDMVGGCMSNEKEYAGYIKIINGQVVKEKVRTNQPTQVDIIHNFFMAKTDVVRDLKWDENLKVLEHFDFFFRGKQKNMKIVLLPHIKVKNDSSCTKSKLYGKKRNRLSQQDWEKYMYKKHGLNFSQV